MADYFAEQEKAKVEARRAEKIRNYQNQISSLNNKMDDLNMEILKLQKEIERLQNYEADRKQVWEQFQTEHQERQQKLQGVQNMISRCLSAERYHEGMQEDVNGTLMCQAISTVEETFKGITQAIQEREEKIEILRNQLWVVDTQISSLYRMIAIA